MKHKFSLSVNPNILKKSKYQQYFHCFIVCLLFSYAFWFSYQQNIVTILISTTFIVTALIRREVLIRGRRLFQCRYSKVLHLIEGGVYLKPGAYQRKYGLSKNQKNIEERETLKFQSLHIDAKVICQSCKDKLKNYDTPSLAFISHDRNMIPKLV